MRKGMSFTLVIIVSAVVLLVSALVLVTMLGSGLSPIGSISEMKNSCLTQASFTCGSTNSLPFNWNTPIKDGKSCESVTKCSSCSCINIGGGTAAIVRSGKTTLIENMVNLDEIERYRK